MQRGEVICLTTDGIADAQNPVGNRYGGNRLQSLLERLNADGPTARGVVDAVGDDVRAFVGTALPADDVTVLAVRWMGSGAAA